MNHLCTEKLLTNIPAQPANGQCNKKLRQKSTDIAVARGETLARRNFKQSRPFVLAYQTLVTMALQRLISEAKSIMARGAPVRDSSWRTIATVLPLMKLRNKPLLPHVSLRLSIMLLLIVVIKGSNKPTSPGIITNY
eukprot:TRINITY_DN688_c0_g1_i1.p1 TRINITY_DN688_c0_g1~~TRINITY_DN688_c0_g1_i1.p1  ORF type:complete len:137 (-),score=5.69 TRINITY_DN688_c0_g1_i1:350-760(-)